MKFVKRSVLCIDYLVGNRQFIAIIPIEKLYIPEY